MPGAQSPALLVVWKDFVLMPLFGAGYVYLKAQQSSVPGDPLSLAPHLLDGATVGLVVTAVAIMARVLREMMKHQAALDTLSNTLATLPDIDKAVRAVTIGGAATDLSSVAESMSLILGFENNMIKKCMEIELERCTDRLRRLGEGRVVVEGDEVIPFAIEQFKDAKMVYATSFLSESDNFWDTVVGKAYLQANIDAADGRHNGTVKIYRIFFVKDDRILAYDRDVIEQHIDSPTMSVAVAHLQDRDHWDNRFITNRLNDFALFLATLRDPTQVSTWHRRDNNQFYAEWYANSRPELEQAVVFRDYIEEQIRQKWCFRLKTRDDLMDFCTRHRIRI